MFEVSSVQFVHTLLPHTRTLSLARFYSFCIIVIVE